ncbi:MAG: pilus assembly protein PilM [Myxococcales bacterium]|nr:pilus assembly protein PilM [Myxococcales bacterium]
MAHVLGLDIRETCVRAVLASVRGKKAEIERYYEGMLLPSTSEEGRVAAIRDALQALATDIQPAPDRVVGVLAGTQASIRRSAIPTATLRRAHEVLPFELDGELPFDVTDAIVDYQVIDAEGAQTNLLVCAAPKANVRKYLAQIDDMRLSPREIAVGAVALDGLTLLVPELTAEGLHVVLDLGASRTEFCAFQGGHCVFARTLSARMNDARTGRLERELHQTVTALRSQTASEMTSMYLTGDAAGDAHAASWFEEKLELKPTPLVLPEAPGTNDELRPRFALAAALAVRVAERRHRMNVRRAEFVQAQSSGDLRKYARPLAIGALVVLGAFSFSVFARWRAATAEHAVLEQQLSDVTGRAFGEATSNPEEARDLIDGKSGSGDPLPKFDAYDALEVISSRIPADIKHDLRKLVIELDEDGKAGRFELRGAVDSIAERDRIAQILSDYECFHDVQKGTTTPAPGATGIAYPIEATVSCPGSGAASAAKKGKSSASR